MISFEPPKPRPKPKIDPVAVANRISSEMKVLYNKPLRFDNNRPAYEVAVSAANKVGVNPALLFSSAFGEGMNKEIATNGEEVSQAYLNAKMTNDFPVDGFNNYGLDTFGTKFPELVKKGYLPQDFQGRFKSYPAVNETERVQTAAFKTNEDALMAKAAYLRDLQDKVREMASKKGFSVDEKGLNYLSMALYNGKAESSQRIFDEYAAAKNKDEFIDKGQTSMKGIHANIYPRLANMPLAMQLITPKK